MNTKRRLAALTLVTLTSACSHPKPSHYVAAACPLPDAALGYPVSAGSSDPTLSPAILSAVARSIAFHWDEKQNPHEPVVPDELLHLSATLSRGQPYSRHRWNPQAGDTAEVRLVYRRGAATPSISLGPGQSSKFAQRALKAAIVARDQSLATRPARDTLPLAPPMTTADSTLVIVRFGTEPRAGEQVARFAVQEREVLPIRATQRMAYNPADFLGPAEGDVMLAFVVRTDSIADPATIRVLRSTSVPLRTLTLSELGHFRYVPAMLDCQAVAQLVEQPFVFRLGGPRAVDQWTDR